MEHDQQPGAAAAAAYKNVRLQEYWPDAPAAWFAAVELTFRVAGVTEEREKFAHVAKALPPRLFQAMMDLVDNEPEDSYTVLKGRMVLAHELTPVQKAARVLQLPTLGNQRPSELMAALQQYCPPGEAGTAMFRASFISRLPSSLQIHLSGAEMGDLRELTQQADRLWLCHGQQPVAAVSSLEQQEMEEPEETVAAMPWKGKGPPSKKGEGPPSQQSQQSGQRTGGKRGGWSGRRGGQRGQRGGQQEASKWVCFKHSQFGARAYFCEDEERCTFSGN